MSQRTAITNAQSRWELNPIGLLPAALWRRHKMSEATTYPCDGIEAYDARSESGLQNYRLMLGLVPAMP